MKLRAALAVSGVLGLSLVARNAEAGLTQSEKAQVRDFYASARTENIGKLRAQVARTDLTVDESVEVMRDAVVVVPLTPARSQLLKTVLFDGPSAGARPVLANAIVRALLARADAVYQKAGGVGVERDPKATEELRDIYGFLDASVANGGHATTAAHDPSSGITTATYEDCSKAMREHVDNNARWLKGDGPIPDAMGLVRAQAQITLFDMLPDGVTRRVDAGDRLGLKGARRKMLTDWGILVEDAGGLDDAKAEKVQKLLARLTGVRTDLEVIYAGDARGPLHARGLVAFAGGTGSGGDGYPFPDEVAKGPFDPAIAGVTHDLAVFATKRALDARGELRTQAEKDAVAAQGDPKKLLGKVRAPSVTHVIGAAVQLLLIDGPRAVDLAYARLVEGKPESASILSDAIGVLAAIAPAPASKDPKGPQGLTIDVGSGGTGTTPMSQIRLAAYGAALAFTLDNHGWTLDRSGPNLAVATGGKDGQALNIANLGTAKVPLRDGEMWSTGGFVFRRVRGAPKVALVPGDDKVGPSLTLVGGGSKGYDVVSTPPPGDDMVVEGNLSVTGGAGGIAVRAHQGRDEVESALLLITPGGKSGLFVTDAGSVEAPVAAPLDGTPAMPVHVKITVKKLAIEAVIGGKTLKGTLRDALASGDVAVFAKKGATVELSKMILRK